MFLWARRRPVSLFTHLASPFPTSIYKAIQTKMQYTNRHLQRKRIPNHTWTIGPDVFILTRKLSCHFFFSSSPLHPTTLYQQQKNQLGWKRKGKERRMHILRWHKVTGREPPNCKFPVIYHIRFWFLFFFNWVLFPFKVQNQSHPVNYHQPLVK